MKKFTISIALIHVIALSLYGQTHYGSSAGTGGVDHSYFGAYAGNAATSSSAWNSYFGTSSGRNTTTGDGNTAIGFYSLYYNTTGSSNVAAGDHALFLNISGRYNAAIGNRALYHNVADENTATGYDALYKNTEGQENTANGSYTLTANTTGDKNVALGANALAYTTTGSRNTAVGEMAMFYNTTGSNNSAYGSSPLTTISGSYNCAFGAEALFYEFPDAGCTDSYNSALGDFSFMPNTQYCPGYNNTTALGRNSKVTASNQVRIGNSGVTSIGGQVGWSNLSDGRFKRDIRNDVSGLDFIKELNPVSYLLDKDAIDKFLGIPDSIRIEHAATGKISQRQVGFVAQDVEAIIKKSGYVFSGIEAPQNENDTYAIRYAEFVVPLVKAAQELSAIVDRQRQEIGKLKEALGKYKEDIRSREKQSAGAALFQNHPNPFSASTEIQMELPEIVRTASLIIYNLEGKELKNIYVNERGTTSMKISGGEFNPGMYLYALIADGKVLDTKRMILTK